MKSFSKIISITYFLFLSGVLLVPLDFYITTNILNEENIPSNKISYIYHLLLFFILYFLFIFSFSNKLKILFYCLIYAILTEILQYFTSRGFEILDIFFNIVGLLISFFFVIYFKINIK